MSRGIVVAVVVTALALGLIFWFSGDTAPPSDATIELIVDGPDGRVWNGTVTASPGTALQSLLAGAEAGNFTVETKGPVGNRYVSAIAGYAESSGGWCIQVDEQDGVGFRDSAVSGDQYKLRDGWSVRWYWTDNQCERN